MSRLTVEITGGARSDMTDIDDWISSNHGVANADQVLTDLAKAIQSLSRFAERGPLLRSVEAFGFSNVRFILVDGFKVVYKVYGNVVRVLAVIHERRDIDTVVLIRMADAF